MRRTLLAFSIATMALTTAADHLIVVKRLIREAV